jgi:hypothetical protein
MKRRDFITLVSGAAASLPFAAHAQHPAMTRVGIVTIQPPTSPPYVAFSQRLRELGYAEGQNLRLDFVNPAQQPGGNAGAVQELIWSGLCQFGHLRAKRGHTRTRGSRRRAVHRCPTARMHEDFRKLTLEAMQAAWPYKR